MRLTYCGNVHPADSVAEWLEVVAEHAVPLAARAAEARRSFGLGAYWPAPLAAELATDAAVRARVAQALAAHSLSLWTLNVFPYEGFHDEVVKSAVYLPDWSHEDRLVYTRQSAEALAGVAAEMGAMPTEVVPLSTLPLGYRGPGQPEPDLRMMARNLARAASALADLRERTGVHFVLALEPEPFCLVETCAETADFLERWLFEEGAWSTVPTRVLRDHLGICVDLCHLAVVGEDPVAALDDLRARGIAVPKIQVSSCLESRDPAGLDELLGYDEPRYLHQTAAEAGARALDLAEVAGRREEFAAGGRVRTHFHMPLWWDCAGPFGSTRAEVERVLGELARRAASGEEMPLLEVETYTWPVLGDRHADWAGKPLAERLQAELDFAAKPFES
ncbi:MAG: metabolite traffic protein EboE [Planctomycetota bacterium]|nr:metabolite traffic protein EboE [Planctomycetota bacterium]